MTGITRFDAAAFTTQTAGEVKDFDVAQYLSPKEARRMDTFIHYGLAAGIQAVSDAGLEAVMERMRRSASASACASARASAACR